MLRSKKNIGIYGEKYAKKHLKKQGFKILDCNYTTKYGEIDIIADDGENIVFIEVKTRTQDPMVAPALAVTKEKQARIIKTAFLYLHNHKDTKQPRFDVVEIIIAKDSLKCVEINHIRSAFIQGGSYGAF